MVHLGKVEPEITLWTIHNKERTNIPLLSLYMAAYAMNDLEGPAGLQSTRKPNHTIKKYFGRKKKGQGAPDP